MSMVIAFQDKDGWFTSGWGARRLFQDVRERFNLNEDDDYKLNQALALNGLIFELMEPAMRGRIIRMLKETVTDLINDKTGNYAGDLPKETYDAYRDRLQNLLNLLVKYEHAVWLPPKER